MTTAILVTAFNYVTMKYVMERLLRHRLPSPLNFGGELAERGVVLTLYKLSLNGIIIVDSVGCAGIPR
jgi:hypothetical protein